MQILHLTSGDIHIFRGRVYGFGKERQRRMQTISESASAIQIMDAGIEALLFHKWFLSMGKRCQNSELSHQSIPN